MVFVALITKLVKPEARRYRAK